MNEHYKRLNVEPLDFAFEKGYNPYETKILKYIVRYPYKNGKEDLEKVIYLMDKLQEYINHNEKYYDITFSNILKFEDLIEFVVENIDVLNLDQVKLLLFLATQRFLDFDVLIDELTGNELKIINKGENNDKD